MPQYLESRMQITNYILLFITFLLGGCRGNSDNNNRKYTYTSENGSYEPKMEEYIYSPFGCPFQVTFLSKPTISTESFLDNINILRAESAHLEIDSEKSFVRAEFIAPKKKIDLKNSMREVLKKYAFANGLTNTIIDFHQNELGNIFKLEGYKTLKIENESIAITYTAECYSDGNVIFVLYGGCPSESYPSNSINNFYESIKKK